MTAAHPGIPHGSQRKYGTLPQNTAGDYKILRCHVNLMGGLLGERVWRYLSESLKTLHENLVAATAEPAAVLALRGYSLSR